MTFRHYVINLPLDIRRQIALLPGMALFRQRREHGWIGTIRVVLRPFHRLETFAIEIGDPYRMTLLRQCTVGGAARGGSE